MLKVFWHATFAQYREWDAKRAFGSFDIRYIEYRGRCFDTPRPDSFDDLALDVVAHVNKAIAGWLQTRKYNSSWLVIRWCYSYISYSNVTKKGINKISLLVDRSFRSLTDIPSGWVGNCIFALTKSELLASISYYADIAIF